MEDISKIANMEGVSTHTPGPGYSGRKKQKKKRPWKSTKKHFNELTRIVEETHQELEKEDSPFRLCIYQDGEDIFIDIVTVGDDGKTNNIFKHDISHDQLEDVIQHLKTKRGLLLDSDV